MTQAETTSPFLHGLRKEAVSVPESGIVEVFHYGRDRKGLIPLWVGEGDLPTPEHIADAAVQSLKKGETFYTHQRGAPEFREAIARYMTRHYQSPYANGAGTFSPSRFFVTIGGMHALQLAMRMVAGTGDEVIVPTPAWPNFAASLTVNGAVPVEVPLRFDSAGWQLDFDALRAAITPKTRAIIINTPTNPTGWVATHDELKNVLDLARQHGLWIIADEIYGRLVFDGARAPSFHDHINDQDRVMFCQTLSKCFAMTGWRVGWLEVPEALGAIAENLIQYSTSGVFLPLQRAGTVALEQGEAFLSFQVARMKQSRDVLMQTLRATGRAHFAEPKGAFYLFCALEGVENTRETAFRLVDEAGVGVAPGTAFGKGGETFFRLCFARDPAQVGEAAARLANWLTR